MMPPSEVPDWGVQSRTGCRFPILDVIVWKRANDEEGVQGWCHWWSHPCAWRNSVRLTIQDGLGYIRRSLSLLTSRSRALG